jgi:hypothetical protein
MISPTIFKKWVDRRRNPVQSVAHTLLCPTNISNVLNFNNNPFQYFI